MALSGSAARREGRLLTAPKRTLAGLVISRALAEARQGETEPQTDLVVSLYKFANPADGTQKEEAIDEALSILAKLDADGKLTESQKGWKDSFLDLRNGSQ